MKELKKRGVKPLVEGRTLSFAEVKQRQRAKDKALHDAMWERDYLPTRVYIHGKHLEHLSRLSFYAGIGQFDLTDTTNLSAYLFKLIDEHLKQQSIDPDGLPKSSLHAEAQQAAAANYKHWAKSHIESLKEKTK